MPYDESFPAEPQAAVAAPPAPHVEAAPVAAEPVAAPESASAPTEPAQAPEPAEPAPAAAAEPAFDEGKFFKQHFGDDAPATAADMKAYVDGLKAKQLTADHEGRLAILGDPAKLAEFAGLQKDFDAMSPGDVMRAKFALDNPGMSEKLQEREFMAKFSQKYPLMAQELDAPGTIDKDDPELAAEMEAAAHYAGADRAALKTAQQSAVDKFVAAAQPAQAPLTAAQQADIQSLPAYLDAFQDSSTLALDLGNGQTAQLPIGKAADFKAAYADTYQLLDKFVLTPERTYNRPNQALVTAFLQNPAAFVQNVAKQALAAQPAPAPAIPVDDLTHSSAARTPKPAAPAPAAGPANHPSYVSADSWQNSNA